jgi:sugar phosphate isomerase/epimerase
VRRLVPGSRADRGGSRFGGAFEIDPPFVFNRSEHLVRLLEVAKHPALKTIYDPGHFDLMTGSTGRPHELLRRIGVANIGYVHLTDIDGTLRDGGAARSSRTRTGFMPRIWFLNRSTESGDPLKKGDKLRCVPSRQPCLRHA